jgi:hypothetical protein
MVDAVLRNMRYVTAIQVLIQFVLIQVLIQSVHLPGLGLSFQATRVLDLRFRPVFST